MSCSVLAGTAPECVGPTCTHSPRQAQRCLHFPICPWGPFRRHLWDPEDKKWRWQHPRVHRNRLPKPCHPFRGTQLPEAPCLSTFLHMATFCPFSQSSPSATTLFPPLLPFLGSAPGPRPLPVSCGRRLAALAALVREKPPAWSARVLGFFSQFGQEKGLLGVRVPGPASRTSGRS